MHLLKMSIQQIPNGEYYYFTKSTGTTILVKHSSQKNSKLGSFYLGTVNCPQELVGKKIRLKVEIIDEKRRT